MITARGRIQKVRDEDGGRNGNRLLKGPERMSGQAGSACDLASKLRSRRAVLGVEVETAAGNGIQ